MFNVDGIPLASQMKSLIQASRGDLRGARETQDRFTERCIGVAQLRSAVEVASGHPERAARTQERFIENTQRLLNGDGVDAVPVISQVKSLAAAAAGDSEQARETQENFTRRCPVVAQVRSAYEVVTKGPDQAMDTQREFLASTSDALDQLPGVGHAKGLVHHALGHRESGEEAIDTATSSAERGAEVVRNALRNIFSKEQHRVEQLLRDSNTPVRGERRQLQQHRYDGQQPQHRYEQEDDAWLRAMLTTESQEDIFPQQRGFARPQGMSAGPDVRPLSAADIQRHTMQVKITEGMCSSGGSCAICLQSFEPGEDACMLCCFHAFHNECSGHWLKMHGTCPVCRAPVRQSEE